jgi:transcriptional regulator with XRE-family HTH domain
MDITHLLKSLLDSGLTQAAIGHAIGCSQSTISDIKNGKIGSVRPAYNIVDGMKKLARQRGIATDLPKHRKR